MTNDELIAAWNTRVMLGGGGLTAEQVRKVLLYHLPHREYYSIEQTDAWQEIADELNVELGNGICKPKWVPQGETQTQEFWRCECGNCGNCFGVETRESFPFKVTIDKVSIPNYCSNCGTRVLKNKK